MTARWASLLILVIGCSSPSQRQPLYPAGSEKDDGHGLLARASSRMLTNEDADNDALPARAQVPRRYRDESYGGDVYGGDVYGGGFGGSAYGGATYAGYAVPPWSYTTVNRLPHYQQQAGLSAAIEGTISWRGAIPRVTTACGTIDPLSIGSERGVAGILVYIERFTTGRSLPSSMGEQRPLSVGGVVVKRGCVLAPTTQVVNPVPAQLAIHGDAKRARLRITQPGMPAGKPTDLQEAGRVAFQLKPGVTKVESDDGSLGAAWIVAIDTPYYAVTDELGRFRIDELAAGTYEVTVWQPPVPTVSNGQLVYGAPVAVRRTLRVDATKTSRLDVALGK